MKRYIGLVVIGLGAVLVIVAALSLRSGGSESGDVAAVEAALRSDDISLPTATTTTVPDQPSDTPTPATTTTPEAPESQVPISDPVGLRIDELNVDAPILPYGVDQRGQMDVPDNVTDVGWYRFGPSPGEPGSAVLAAHVDLSESGPGVFFNLRTLEEGDGIAVLHADGSEINYRVVARVTYEKDELPLDVIFSREGPPVLTLITCGGSFDSSASRYDSNIVVYAVPDIDNGPTPGSSL